MSGPLALCEGRPNQPCPYRAAGSLSQGDLMLCSGTPPPHTPPHWRLRRLEPRVFGSAPPPLQNPKYATDDDDSPCTATTLTFVTRLFQPSYLGSQRRCWPRAAFWRATLSMRRRNSTDHICVRQKCGTDRQTDTRQMHYAYR